MMLLQGETTLGDPEAYLYERAMLDSFTLCSREEASVEKTMMDNLLEAEVEWDETWWSTRWYPFASDGAGQLLCVHGDTGEVIEFLHDDDPRPVRGASRSGASWEPRRLQGRMGKASRAA